MKKSLIALAVAAGTIAGAQAADTTTLYGSVGFSSTIAKTNNLGFKDVKDGIEDNVWDVETAASKIGVKGTEDLDNGLQAFFNVEGNFDSKNLNYAYLGLKGDFGTLTIGKQKTLFKQVTDTGLFQQVGVSQVDAALKEAKEAGFDAPIGTASKVISYVTPEASGLKFGASVQADADNEASKGADVWEVAAMYEQNGLNAGVVYNHAVGMYDNEKYTLESTGLNVGYANDQYEVVGRVTHLSSLATEFGIEGQYFSGKNTFRAGVGLLDPKGGDNNIYTYALGYQYNFSDRTYTWVEGQYDDLKGEGTKDGFKALVGIRHDF